MSFKSKIISKAKKLLWPLLIALWLWFVVYLLGSYIAGITFLITLLKNPFDVHLATFPSVFWAFLNNEISAPANKVYFSAFLGYVFPTIGAFIGVMYLKSIDNRSMHGNAKFATWQEVKASGLFASDGILLGKFNGKFLVFSGNEFVIISAPTRSGKGVGIVIPNCLHYDQSLLVLDIKGENYDLTSEFRRKHGQKVFIFAPYQTATINNPDGSKGDENNPELTRGETHRWNMLSYISKNPIKRDGDIMRLGFILFPDQGNENDFFRTGARGLYLGIVLYLIETGGLLTMGEVLRYSMSRGTGKPTKVFFSELINPETNEANYNKLSEKCINAIASFVAMPDNTLGSVLAEFQNSMQPWQNSVVDAATSGDDFHLDQFRRQKMTVYIVVTPPQLKQAAALINVFFSQFLDVNTQVLPEHDPTLKYKTLLLLDEFTAIGKIEILIKAVAFIAGYGLRLMPIIQSYSQLKDLYGDDAAKTLVSNMAVKIVYPPRELDDAKLYSETLGTYTKIATSKGTSGDRKIFSISNVTSDSINESEQARALLMPQELMEMARPKLDRKGNLLPEPIVILYEKAPPILATKIRWYLDEIFTVRALGAAKKPLQILDYRQNVPKSNKPLSADEQAKFEQSGTGAIILSEAELGAISSVRDSKFMLDLKKRFGSLIDDPMVTLDVLKQTGLYNIKGA